jgi:cytochrome c2
VRGGVRSLVGELDREGRPGLIRRPGGSWTRIVARSVTTLLFLLASVFPARAGEWPDNPLQGRLLFESKRCDQCHGIATGSKPGIGPQLGESRFRGSFLDLGAALWNHVPGMTVSFEARDYPWPELTPDEATRLMSFLFFIDYLGRPGEAAAGRRIFTAKGCAACHAIGGAGRKVGPDLAELRRFASPLYVAQAIWNHGPSMFESMRARGIPPPHFEEGDLADLSAYIRQRARGGPQERVLLTPGNPNRGRGVFEEKSCAQCHARGVGGGRAGAPDLAVSRLPRTAEAIAGNMWNHGLAMRSTMREQGISWPRLSTRELADLVAYVYFLPFADRPGDPERGAEVFVQRSCAGCHAPEGEEEPLGPALEGSEATRSAAAMVAAMWSHAPVMKEVVLSEGRPWPELSGDDLRDLLAYLSRQSAAR